MAEADVTTGSGQGDRRAPSLAEATWAWARIGVMSFGGPAGQIALMHSVTVEEKKWISERRFLHALNFCMLLPGPEAMQLATYIGWLMHGVRGGLIAGLLFILPGFLVILALSTAYALYQTTDLLQSIFFGLKAAVLAIVLQAVFKVGARALKNNVMIALAALAFIGIFAFNVPFPLIVFSAALFGFLAARYAPSLIPSNAADDEDEDEETGGSKRAMIGGAVRTAIVCIGMWALPFILVLLLAGTDTVWFDIAGFFSKMAVVTFGGAYAVLAYVGQQAVETYGWLAPGEMIDGLAMAETTPGPLIIILTFVGFLASFRDAAPLDQMTAGVLGATLATWVTFAPCFLWIFLGAPFVERLRHNAALSGALTAITAAVVGVILNLAVWFGINVLFREVFDWSSGPVSLTLANPASLDIKAALLGIVAVLALFRFRLGVPSVLAICCVAGLGLQMLPF